MAAYPEIGQRLLHATLVAYVTAADTAAATLTIEYAKMFKANASGALQQCIIDPASSSKRYPEDCAFELRHFSISPGTGRLTAVVNRSSVGPMDAAGWSPLNSDYVGDTQMSGGKALQRSNSCG
jgi:hypothetical protein